MKLKECNMGLLVKNDMDLGHIVGLTRQYPGQKLVDRGEVIPLVLFADEKIPRGVHPENLIKL